MADKLHVVKTKDGEWIVKKEGNQRPSAKKSSKKQAMAEARRLASSGDTIFDHKANGAIRKGISVR